MSFLFCFLVEENKWIKTGSKVLFLYFFVLEIQQQTFNFFNKYFPCQIERLVLSTFIKTQASRNEELRVSFRKNTEKIRFHLAFPSSLEELFGSYIIRK